MAERESAEEQRARKDKELEEARKDRQERLGHEIHEEKKSTSRARTRSKKTEETPEEEE